MGYKMAESIPQTTRQWTMTGANGFDSLSFDDAAPLPPLGDTEVLVRMRAVGLNYRDLIIARGTYPFPVKNPVVPGSDGAGEVLAVGARVTRFAPGDRVVTLFAQAHLGGANGVSPHESGLGGAVDGVLRAHAAFDQQGLVPLPAGLSFVEAATLSCAALTAWNALFGLEGRALKPGDTVLTQGTGGVSVFALQFAKAAGARVIATTSSPDKAARLEQLGADHIVDYAQTPQWGAEVRRLAPAGVQHVVEVAGPASMRQSLDSVAINGVINIIGFLGGGSVRARDDPGFVECLAHICTVRGVVVGNRALMEDMCRGIEGNVDRLRPIVDTRVFSLEEAREAYEYQWAQKHFGKVCIQID